LHIEMATALPAIAATVVLQTLAPAVLCLSRESVM
jgi:hypothetical protein